MNAPASKQPRPPKMSEPARKYLNEELSKLYQRGYMHGLDDGREASGGLVSVLMAGLYGLMIGAGITYGIIQALAH